MTVTAAWYNEPDPFKAAVIREAIKAGAIADGVVDERSIKDVRASDLVEYTQCHFFAGGGFWSLALRRAGWPDDRHVWTGSCPCPSFSAAGKGGGFDDPRHLWPDWEKLIRECRPATIFGEQADDSIGYGWLDLVQTDLEAQAYAVGKVVLGTCSVGGADIRQRLYFVAYAAGSRYERRRSGEAGVRREARQQPERLRDVDLLGDTPNRGCGIVGDAGEPGSGGHADGAEQSGGMGHTFGAGLEGHRGDGKVGDKPGREREVEAGHAAPSGESRRLGDPDGHGCEPRRQTEPPAGYGSSLDTAAGECVDGMEDSERERLDPRSTPGAGFQSGDALAEYGGGSLALADASGIGRQRRQGAPARSVNDRSDARRVEDHDGSLCLRQVGDERYSRSSPLNGPWRDADWLLCRDGKWRPVESGTFPLAHGDPCRVGRLRLYGDAINIEVATAWIKAYLESVGK